MKLPTLLTSFHLAAIALAALSVANPLHAKFGSTDAIAGTSNGAANSNSKSTGGGNKSTPAPVVVTTPAVVTTPVVAPTPATSFVSKTLTFTPINPVNGVTPLCTGAYHIDPYYPTLSLMTVNVELSSVNAPDGSILTVSVTGTGGTLYPFTSNAIYVLGGNGLCTYSVYVTPGTVLTGVKVSDSAGRVIASGI